jgi:hypothetical protein
MTELQAIVLAFSAPLIVVGIWRAVFILTDIRKLLKQQRL